jgi:hypothetical protein
MKGANVVELRGQHRTLPPWLFDAATLLREPDPGPTPWLVERLIVDEAILAVVGRWKTTKSYGLLDICISIAAGEPAFGGFSVPNPGPVVYVCEESGKAALWRRLDALARGRAIKPDRLSDLHLAANARIKLDDRKWQNELIELGQRIQPRLFVFDPLARMKAPGREENAQADMAPIVEFLRVLRDETRAAVGFVHHTGHGSDHMRGSSDLESVWESRLAWKRVGQSPVVTVEPEHREAEGGDSIGYRIDWHESTRTIRFAVEAPGGTNANRKVPAVLSYVVDHAPISRKKVAAGVTGRKVDVLAAITQLVESGALVEGDDGLRPGPGDSGSAPKGAGTGNPLLGEVPGSPGNPRGTGNPPLAEGGAR